MKKTTVAAQTGAGIAALALLAAFAQADSISYSDINNVEINIENAAMAASAVTPGEIVEIELEMDNKEAIWEVEIVNAANQVVTVEINGQTGEILSTSADDDDDAEMPLTYAVNLSQAVDIIRAVEQGAIIEAELENDDGLLIWEVESISDNDKETTFRINAQTGEVLI